MKALILTIAVTLAASVVPATAVAGRSTLQRDADAIRAVGVTGGYISTVKDLVDRAICD